MDGKVFAVAKAIGRFYLKKHKGDYAAAELELFRLQITDIKVTKDRIEITLGRPGMLIGLRATNIDNLEKFLQAEVGLPTTINGLNIVETSFHIYDILIPRKPD